MVTLFGMSDKIGFMATKNRSTGYLGEENSYTCSDGFRCQVDEEVREILQEQMSKTEELLRVNKDKLEKLAKFVFEKEIVTGEEFIKELNKA